MENKKVYEAIVKVSAKLAVNGITKDKKNESQGYRFRGIDDIYNALAPIMADAKLCILPNVLERTVIEKASKSGGTLFYVTVKVDHAFVSAEDGSEHHVVTYGEAMDSGDKATNKAMSAAYKYAAIEAFCIPTEGDNDADSKTHEIAAPVYISEKQVSHLVDQLIELERDESKFCSYIGVRSLKDITVSDFNKAQAALDASRQKKVAVK